MHPRWCLAQQFVPFWRIVGKYHNLSTPPSLDVWIISRLRFVWIKLLWTLCEHLGLTYSNYIFNFTRNYHIVSPSGYTSSYSWGRSNRLFQKERMSCGIVHCGQRTICGQVVWAPPALRSWLCAHTNSLHHSIFKIITIRLHLFLKSTGLY